MAAETDKIGLALGSGASRGWSHIGVLRSLIDEGIEPDVVVGTSVGAMIGAAYLAGALAGLALRDSFIRPGCVGGYSA